MSHSSWDQLSVGENMRNLLRHERESSHHTPVGLDAQALYRDVPSLHFGRSDVPPAANVDLTLGSANGLGGNVAVTASAVPPAANVGTPWGIAVGPGGSVPVTVGAEPPAAAVQMHDWWDGLPASRPASSATSAFETLNEGAASNLRGKVRSETAPAGYAGRGVAGMGTEMGMDGHNSGRLSARHPGLSLWGDGRDRTVWGRSVEDEEVAGAMAMAFPKTSTGATLGRASREPRWPDQVLEAPRGALGTPSLEPRVPGHSRMYETAMKV